MPGSPKILCADGHQDTCEFLAFTLRLDGYCIFTAATMQEALAILKTTDFDLIIAEQILPDGYGSELHQQLLAQQKTTPILFFTTATRPQDRQMLEERGMYLAKPADLADLRQAISKSLQTV